ncbi:MAG: DUF6015 family protein [Thermoplasmata archaeon]
MSNGNNNRLCETLTVDDLTSAIKNCVDGQEMQDTAARSMAEHVLNFFGYSERIIDNILEQEDRDVFYMLEDAGLLTTEREQTTLYDGREWRIHYWLFQKDKIIKLKSQNTVIPDDGKDAKSVYDDIPEGVWSSRMGVENK